MIHIWSRYSPNLEGTQPSYYTEWRVDDVSVRKSPFNKPPRDPSGVEVLPAYSVSCFAFSVWCVVCGVWCLVFSVGCLVFSVQCLWFRFGFQGSGFRVYGVRATAGDLLEEGAFPAACFAFGFSDFRFRV